MPPFLVRAAGVSKSITEPSNRLQRFLRLPGFLYRLWAGGLFRNFHFHRRRQVKIPAAVLTELNVLRVHERHNHADGQMHVTAGADLVANNRNALFPVGDQTVIVAENLLWNLGAQFRRGLLGVLIFDFAKLDGLEFDQVLK